MNDAPSVGEPEGRQPRVEPPARAHPRRRRRLILLAILSTPLLYLGFVAAGLPARSEVRRLARHRPRETSVMRQRDTEARRAGRTPRRVWRYVPLSAISRHLVHAVVAAEDPNFFGHEGIDWGAVRESIEVDIKRRRLVRGGSTITQQLAKNLFFTTYKSPTRKLRELVVARWLEEDLSKGRILELYLNVIEWGDGVYGCESAARLYYGRPAAALNETEAAGLAAMIPSPRRINPRVNPARHARAQRRILRLMKRIKFVKRQVRRFGATPTPTPTPVPTPAADIGDVEPTEELFGPPAPEDMAPEGPGE